MVKASVLGLNCAVMPVTSPILTPLNRTGEPTARPFTDPEKYITYFGRFDRNLPEPKIAMPATARATAPTTKAPMIVLLAGLAMIVLPLTPALSSQIYASLIF